MDVVHEDGPELRAAPRVGFGERPERVELSGATRIHRRFHDFAAAESVPQVQEDAGLEEQAAVAIDRELSVQSDGLTPGFRGVDELRAWVLVDVIQDALELSEEGWAL